MSEVKTVIGKVSLTPKGTYDPAKTYERLDLIQHEGRGYIVLAQTIQGVTPADGTDYMLLAVTGLSAVGAASGQVPVADGNGSWAWGTVEGSTAAYTDGDEVSY